MEDQPKKRMTMSLMSGSDNVSRDLYNVGCWWRDRVITNHDGWEEESRWDGRSIENRSGMNQREEERDEGSNIKKKRRGEVHK